MGDSWTGVGCCLGLNKCGAPRVVSRRASCISGVGVEASPRVGGLPDLLDRVNGLEISSWARLLMSIVGRSRAQMS
jgi:hypothetical protein